MSAPDPAQVLRLRAASEWVARLNEPAGALLTDELLAWCASDAANPGAFEEMTRLWSALSRLPPPATLAPVDAPGRWRRIGYALAAAVLLAAVSLWLLTREGTERFATSSGEQRGLVLRDGSRVDLAPVSSLRVQFTRGHRDLELERGQAFFRVVHDASRPFVVHAAGLTVTAVGTAFDVRSGSRSTVAVDEGSVRVAPAPPPGAGSSLQPPTDVTVAMGQQATLMDTARGLTVTSIAPRTAGSWRSGTLQFQGESLSEVVEVINGYGQRRIALAPSLRDTRFTGTVSLKHLNEWFHAVEQIYAVQVVDRGNNEVLIQPAR